MDKLWRRCRDVNSDHQDKGKQTRTEFSLSRRIVGAVSQEISVVQINITIDTSNSNHEEHGKRNMVS